MVRMSGVEPAITVYKTAPSPARLMRVLVESYGFLSQFPAVPLDMHSEISPLFIICDCFFFSDEEMNAR